MVEYLDILPTRQAKEMSTDDRDCASPMSSGNVPLNQVLDKVKVSRNSRLNKEAGMNPWTKMKNENCNEPMSKVRKILYLAPTS